MNEKRLFYWEAEVRGYELDCQGIVNNAVYLHYFDYVRTKHLYELGVDWIEWHKNGYSIVLAHVDLSYRSSLRANDKFYVVSEISKSGHIKIIFDQKIYLKENDKLIATAINTVICVDTKSKRPILPAKLSELLFS